MAKQESIYVLTTNSYWTKNKNKELPVHVIDIVPQGVVAAHKMYAAILGVSEWEVRLYTLKEMKNYSMVNTGRKRYKIEF